jgi:hypothetical protein
LTLHFHPRCHDAWKAGLEPPATEPTAPVQSQAG